MTFMGLEFFIWTILTLTEPFAEQQHLQFGETCTLHRGNLKMRHILGEQGAVSFEQ
jgi:hypothetical protein